MEEIVNSFAGGPQVVTLIIAIAGVISAFVPDDKLPKPVAAVLNFVALNLGKAANDPARNGSE